MLFKNISHRAEKSFLSKSSIFSTDTQSVALAKMSICLICVCVSALVCYCVCVCVCVRDCVITLILPLIGQKKTFSWVYSPWDSMNPQESPPICPLEALGVFS